MIAKVGDIYAIWNEEIEKWSLVQVIQQNEKKNIALIDIDFFSDDLPTEQNLSNLHPLVIDHHFWKGDYNTRFIGTNKVPNSVKFIANQPLIVNTQVNSYSVSDWNVLQPVLQYKWNRLPKQLTDNFKNALQSAEKVSIGNQNRRVSTSKIWIDSDNDIPIDELYKLPALTAIECDGKFDELIEFIEKNPLIDELDLRNHKQEIIDISKTNLKRLIIECSTLKRLKLNKEIRFLSIIDNHNNLEIDHPLQGKFLGININLESLKQFDLPYLKSIRSSKNEVVDFERIVEMYPNIQELKIWGKPGVARNFKSIEKLSQLKYLQIQDLFEMSENDILNPKLLPNLEFLWLTSVPKEFGKAIKKQFKHIVNLSATKLRDEKWLVENMNNPFRNWDGREGITKANAKKAFNAFKKLNTTVSKNPETDILIASFTAFVDVFNKMEQKLECIHTIEREEIYEIYMTLAAQTSIEEQLFDVFERNRVF